MLIVIILTNIQFKKIPNAEMVAHYSFHYHNAVDIIKDIFLDKELLLLGPTYLYQIFGYSNLVLIGLI